MQIHELNDYRGNLDSSALVAVDDGNDTGKVTVPNLLANATQAVEELSKRVDNIIAGGDAPSEAEIIDARLGYNGTSYENLGAAIRDPDEIAADMLEKHSEGLNAIQTELFEEMPMYPIWENGSYRQNGLDTNLNYVRYRFEAGTYTIKVTGTGFDFSAYSYDSDSSGTSVFDRRSVDTTYRFESDFYVSISNAALTALTPSEKLQIAKLIKITKQTHYNPAFSASIRPDVLKELYVPNLEAGWKIYRVYVEADSYRFGITDKDGNIILDGFSNIDSSYSDKIQKLVDSSGNIIAYYILHYPGENYYGFTNAVPNTVYTSSLDYNPRIKELLSREENLVLLGDSIFGRNEENLLESFLNEISEKRAFNCGFGGCRMSTENNNYKYFSFTGVCDAIASGDFSGLANNLNLQPAMYPKAYASLAAVDWTKPTTVFVNYVNNDITASVPIGDNWSASDDLSVFDKETLLGAMNYGINKLLTAYPHIRIVFFTPVYREMSPDGGVTYVPFYDFVNSGGIAANAYRDGIRENAKLQGISVFDFTKYGGRNPYNFSYLLIDHSHWNIKGYQMFAKILDKLDKSYMG